MIRICPFKEREKEGGERRSQLGGQWKVSMIGAQWKKKEKEKGNTFSPLPTFPQQILFKPSFFSIDLKVLFYHGYKSLLTHFLVFL
jgi:hypothetical protein